ncbi:MAG: hypothetical protein KGS60_02850 [Verrucomicrobia bacterium]|nr:hypothetical protein [Verrucomicrobiota bacterium]
MIPRPFTFLLPACFLAACGQSKPELISHTRELTGSERKPVLDAPASERFQFAMPAPAPPQPGPEAASGPRLAWDTPPGWKETPHPMRDISLSFGDGGECSVVRAGGSLVDNVNRWRKQMGLEAISETEAAALPTRNLFGGPGVLVELDGSYQAMGTSAATPGYRMVGVILAVPSADSAIFVKMVGPRDLVQGNEAAFEAFCDSLRIVNS